MSRPDFLGMRLAVLIAYPALLPVPMHMSDVRDRHEERAARFSRFRFNAGYEAGQIEKYVVIMSRRSISGNMRSAQGYADSIHLSPRRGRWTRGAVQHSKLWVLYEEFINFGILLQLKMVIAAISLAAVYAHSTAANDIAERRFAVHDAGLQRMLLDNQGVLGDPNDESSAAAGLEYPPGSRIQFIRKAGLWVGGIVDGSIKVSTSADGSGRSSEFMPLTFATAHDPCVIGWLGKGVVSDPSPESGEHTSNGQYWGMGHLDVDDDGDGRMDEDPAGDMSQDHIDNDEDGLFDHDDPNYDGDMVPGHRDDDGDGLIDEDDSAAATQELITAYVDSFSTEELGESNGESSPLGIRVVQHTSQWGWDPFDDFTTIVYEITNISQLPIHDMYFAHFMDFDVEHVDYPDHSYDDYTFYMEDIQTGVGSDLDGDSGLLWARFIGLRALGSSVDGLAVTYRFWDRLRGDDPSNDESKYNLLASTTSDSLTYEEGDYRIILVFGPHNRLGPGESVRVTYAIINGKDEEELRDHAERAKEMADSGLLGPSFPHVPQFSTNPIEDGAQIQWNHCAESSMDRLTHHMDFQGYNIWRAQDRDHWTLLASYDLPDTIGMNLGWPPPLCENDEWSYEFIDHGIFNGLEYSYVITAFDDGDNGDGIHTFAWDERNGGVGVLESDRENVQTIVPAGSAAGPGEVGGAYVVPNPYRGSWVLERGGESDRIDFRGLPETCEITVYTLAGDLVKRIRHDNGLSWEAWDLKSEDGRRIAGGIYLYRVESEGNDRIGKFVVMR